VDLIRRIKGGGRETHTFLYFVVAVEQQLVALGGLGVAGGGVDFGAKLNEALGGGSASEQKRAMWVEQGRMKWRASVKEGKHRHRAQHEEAAVFPRMLV
jgi:hypothetical protein